ncbi:phosphoribosylglycinamide formyltransferase [Enterococcus faecalis]
MKIAIFASGNGSNFQAICEAATKEAFPGEIVCLFCDQPAAFVLKRAAQRRIPAVTFSPNDYGTKAAYEEEILSYLKHYQVELVVLAGYMRIIGPTILEAFPKKIINIHPSLLPQFPGLQAIKAALIAGVHTTGVTIHYVDQGIDTGPIIAQERVPIEKKDTLASLTAKIHQVEHRLYPASLVKIIQANKEKQEQ